jgi:adenylate cyclase
MAKPAAEIRKIPLGRKLLLGGVVGLAAGAIAAVASGLWPSYEDTTLDLRHRHLSARRPGADQVAVVLIDEASVARFSAEDKELRWPWPRELQAAIVKYLKWAGARAVVFDLLFIDGSRLGVDDDRKFGKAIEEAGNVHLATKLVQGPGSGKSDPPVVERSGVAVSGWRYPGRAGLDRALALVPEIARAAAGVGVVNVVKDDDNTLRRADLLLPLGGRLLPSLGFAGALAALGPGAEASIEGRRLLLGGRQIPLEPDGRLLVRFYREQFFLETCQAYNVIQSWLRHEDGNPPFPEAAPEKFKDRVVFVGASLSGDEDMLTVPIATSFAFPGVLLHATVAANVLAREFLERPVPGVRHLLIGLLGLAAGLLTFALWKPLPAAGGALALAALWTAGSAMAFRSGLDLDIFYPALAVAIAYLGQALAGYFGEGKQKRVVSRAFEQYLSPVVIRDLMKDPAGLRLGGEKREITVFFSDIKAFSTFSEKMSAEELVAFLNVYLGAMTDVILERRGVVDKYIGDAVVAFWGAPERLENDAREACLAALEQREALARLNQRFRAEGRPEIAIRAGLNRGPASVGNMGSAQRFAYTAMGDTVNIASRLEGANKFFGTSFMISESVRSAAGETIVTRRLGKIRVVGKAMPVEVHELVAARGSAGEAALRRIEAYEKALALLAAGEYSQAGALFEEYLAGGADHAAERCLTLARDLEARKASWDGVFELSEK